MTFTNIQEALDYFNSNLDWETSSTQAKNALQALRYLKIHRPTASSHMNSNLSFSEIDSLISKAEEVVNRSRRLSWTIARPRFY